MSSSCTSWLLPIFGLVALLTTPACFSTEFSNDDGGKGNGIGGEAADAAPRVVSISPANGTQGVKEDAVITIEFNQAMDKVPTQAAYGSTDDAINSANVIFAWNDAGTELRVIPKDPLPYKSVTDPKADAQAFKISINTAARGKNGREMTTPFESTFKTLKRVTQTLEFLQDGDASGHVTKSLNISGNFGLYSAELAVGCNSSVARSYWSYDLSGLPAEAQVEQGYLILGFYRDQQGGWDSMWSHLAGLMVGPTSFTPPLKRDLGTFDLPISGGVNVNKEEASCSTDICQFQVDQTASLQLQVDGRKGSEPKLSQYGVRAVNESCQIDGIFYFSSSLTVVYVYE